MNSMMTIWIQFQICNNTIVFVRQVVQNINFLRNIRRDRKSTRLNSSHLVMSYAVFCLKKKKLYMVLLANTLAIATTYLARNVHSLACVKYLLAFIHSIASLRDNVLLAKVVVEHSRATH